MGLLVAITTVFSFRLLNHARSETDPIKRSHMHLVSSFPLCLLIAWLLTRAGEGFPIISVAITIVCFAICVWIKTLVSGTKTADEIERRVKEEYRKTMLNT
jgi:hypothetical protein